MKIGDRVLKISGDTHPSGTVIGIVKTINEKERIIVELDYAQLLHIYSSNQLEVIRDQ